MNNMQDVSSTNSNLLEAGMVITIEPGIDVPGVAGVRIEDDILVTNEGYEIIHYEKRSGIKMKSLLQAHSLIQSNTANITL